MICKERLEKVFCEVDKGISVLFKKMKKCQKNDSNNFLLFLLNGECKKEDDEYCHYYIHETPKSLAKRDLDGYFNFLYKTVTIKNEVSVTERLKNQNEHNLATQFELNFYLKLWEDSSLLSRLYNITEILEGRLYDWEIDITSESCTISRKTFLEISFPNSFRKKVPKFLEIYNTIYSRQIRNAVAHSKYYISNNTIYLLNYNENDGHELKSMTVDKWEEIFHLTFAFYRHFSELIEREKNEYASQSIINVEVKSNSVSLFGDISLVNNQGQLDFNWSKNPK